MTGPTHNVATPTTYILGAGFSKAVSALMPLTDELGADCIARDPDVLGTAVGPGNEARPNFEVWLSRRAEDQPYRTAAENLHARAIFAGAVPLIADSLNERQSQVLSLDAPQWLRHLVCLWHSERSPVITFNYDCLVECVVDTYRLPAFDDRGKVPWASVLRFVPAPAKPESYGEMEGRAPWETFQLHKLHGSLNWFWTAGDVAGSTIQRGRLPGSYCASEPMTESERRWRHPGRETFLVPPAALKSSYYQNPVTREIWSSAHSAARGSSKLVLMGYSLPLTDLSTAGLIASAVESGSVSSIEIVDRNPEAVRSNLLQAVNIEENSIALFDGDDAVADYVSMRWADHCREIANRLAALVAERPVDVRGALVYWDGLEVAAAVSVSVSGHVLTIEVDEPAQQWDVTSVERTQEVPSSKGLRPLLDLGILANALSASQDVRVRTAMSLTSPLLDAEIVDMTAEKTGHGKWLVLKCPGPWKSELD